MEIGNLHVLEHMCVLLDLHVGVCVCGGGGGGGVTGMAAQGPLLCEGPHHTHNDIHV